jgi:hypothetical protein
LTAGTHTALLFPPAGWTETDTTPAAGTPLPTRHTHIQGKQEAGGAAVAGGSAPATPPAAAAAGEQQQQEAEEEDVFDTDFYMNKVRLAG